MFIKVDSETQACIASAPPPTPPRRVAPHSDSGWTHPPSHTHTHRLRLDSSTLTHLIHPHTHTRQLGVGYEHSSAPPASQPRQREIRASARWSLRHTPVLLYHFQVAACVSNYKGQRAVSPAHTVNETHSQQTRAIRSIRSIAPCHFVTRAWRSR
jgi:hypothetical protein